MTEPSGSPPKRRRIQRSLPYSTRPIFRVDPNLSTSLHTLVPRPTVLDSNQKAAWDAQKRLVNDFAKRKAANALFPPLLDNSTTRQAIERFQQHSRAVAESTMRVYASCGGFMTSSAKTLAKTSELYQESIDAGISKEADLDVCGLENDESSFCFDQIQCFKPPKFGSINEVNVLLCQRFSEELKDVTLVEVMLSAVSMNDIEVRVFSQIGMLRCYFDELLIMRRAGLRLISQHGSDLFR